MTIFILFREYDSGPQEGTVNQFIDAFLSEELANRMAKYKNETKVAWNKDSYYWVTPHSLG